MENNDELMLWSKEDDDILQNVKSDDDLYLKLILRYKGR